jgi:hypothetical protein
VHTGFWFADLRVSRPLGRPRHKWGDSIKIDLSEIKWRGMNWIDAAEDTDRWRAVVNAVMNLLVQ